MRINWRLRLQNKTTLMAIITAGIGLVYQGLAIFGIVSPISEDMVYKVLGLAMNLLVMLGIVVDPTTKGISDTDTAMAYRVPNRDRYSEKEIERLASMVDDTHKITDGIGEDK